jgi:hypothetical protein
MTRLKRRDNNEADHPDTGGVQPDEVQENLEAAGEGLQRSGDAMNRKRKSEGGGMMMPTVHLNGTSRDQLVEEIGAAVAALQAAVTAMVEAAPNARDYYVQGPDAYPAARREHESRLHRIADVIHELSTIYETIAQ